MKKAVLLLGTVCLCCGALAASGAQLPETLYYNSRGGSYYHADVECPSVKKEYLPMTAFDSGLLGTPEYSGLLPCTLCIGAEEMTANPRQAESAGQEPKGTTVSIGSEAAARAFAEAFFASPYVNEAPDGRAITVSKTQEGWQAALDSTDGTLSVSFTEAGRISQYQNEAYPLPTLEGIVTEPIPLNDVRRIDTLRNALFPDMPNNTCGIYASEGDASFYVLDSFTFWLGLVLNTDTIRLVAYTDLETDAARYPGYLTRGEAAAAARRAIAEACGLTAGQTEGLSLLQADFVLQKNVWTDADVPLPYWFIVFGDTADGTKTRYEALIDAQTGDTLELHDPATAGNG